MAKRTVWKCQLCGVADTHEDDMDFEMVGIAKPQKKRYHKTCYIEHLKIKEFKAEEQVKKDALNETLKDIYGVSQVPSQAWTLLEYLRNGENIFGAKQKNVSKRYKEGYDYLLIKETFEYCSETIEYWNSVKNFNGFMGAFKYALTIVIDKVYIVEQRVKQREKQKIMVEKHIESIDVEDYGFDSSYKKPSKSKADITDFLDD